MMIKSDSRTKVTTLPSIGLLIPVGNTVMEGDFHRELDGTLRVHTSRMMLEEVTVSGEQRMLDDEAEPAAHRLRKTRPVLVAFGCTSASSLHGEAYDEALRRRLGNIVGAPVVGVLSSAIAMLVDKGPIGLFTPYVTELSDRIAASLRAGGVEVKKVCSLGISDISTIGAIAPEEIVEHVGSMDLSGTETVFCSCTNLRAYEAYSELLAVTRRNIVTSNQAMVDTVRVFCASDTVVATYENDSGLT